MPKSPRPYDKVLSNKPHDAPMGKRDMYFALDCEMVGVGTGGSESAVARVAVVNWDGEVVLDRYVRPDRPITDYRTHVSGVRAADMESKGALSLEVCRKKVKNMLKGKILIGHALENDLRLLSLSHPWTDVRDSAMYEPFMRPCSIDGKAVLRPRKLRELAWEQLGLQIQDTSGGAGVGHSPMEDATAAMGLYKATRMEWESSMQRKINQAQRLMYSKKQQEAAKKGERTRAAPVHWRGKPRDSERYPNEPHLNEVYASPNRPAPVPSPYVYHNKNPILPQQHHGMRSGPIWNKGSAYDHGPPHSNFRGFIHHGPQIYPGLVIQT